MLKKISLTLRKYNGSLFGLTSVHQVLVNFARADRLLSQSYHTINAEPFQYTLLTRVFGAKPSPQLKKKLEDSWKDLLGPIERLFLNDAASETALKESDVLEKATRLVTFSDRVQCMERWELGACVQVATCDSAENPGIAKVNFQSLIRDFGACIAIPLLYGQDFLNRYPQLLNDFWTFDNNAFALLMIGIPSWAPFKIMRDGVQARSRLGDEMEALYRRIDQYQHGDSVDFDADMSDISHAALERNKIYSREDWPFRHRGEGDLAVLWGQNANTQPMLFWLLVYIYSTPGLLSRLRDETAPFVTMSQEKPASIASINFAELARECALLKSCLFETYRMANEAASIRYVARSVTVQDGEYTHELRPGMFVTVPHALSQQDASIYPNPENFVPERFLKFDKDSGRSGARYGTLRPWGSGAAMCKGRIFAEKELITLSSAIINLWEISPASDTWKLPAMMPGTGVKRPFEDIRVRISRRVLL